jgi:hypothetical protein
MPGTTTELAPERLFALSHPYELDGRVTSYPADARGFAPMQCYLLKEGDSALLMGTGLTRDQDDVVDEIGSVLGSAQLSLMPLGFDFTQLCNVRPIADRIGVEFVYQPQFNDAPWTWLNLRPEFPVGETDGLRRAKTGLMKTGEPIFVDSDGTRKLDLIVPPIRLLPNHWLYDEATRTLFTVDMFTWVWKPTADGPWVVTEDDEDPTTLETLQHALFYNRYWWLSGADTTRLRRALHDLFDSYEIETIAPEHGCVLHGAAVVQRHYELLDELLAGAPDEPAIGVEVGTWRFAEAR